MQPSNLQLQQYFVTELNVSVNRDFDPEKDVNLSLKDVVAEPECLVKKDNDRHWQVRLRIKHTQNPESNSPYFFSIEIVGFFHIHEDVPEKRIGLFAEINAPSVLFSMAREILRASMSNGPFEPILLPTVCFLSSNPEADNFNQYSGRPDGKDSNNNKMRDSKETTTEGEENQVSQDTKDEPE